MSSRKSIKGIIGVIKLTLKVKLDKYFYISYYSFKKSSIYWINNLMGMISSIIFICIVYSMWTAVYSNSNSFNYSELNKTLSYVVIVTIINQVISRNTEMELGSRVVNGNISVDLIRPINFSIYLFFSMVGVAFFNFVFSIIPLLLTAILIFKINILGSFTTLLAFMTSLLLSFILTYIFEFSVGLISFLTTQVFGVSLLKSSLINILAGLTVPLTFYPEALQRVFLNLPFQAMYYIPTSIYVGMPYKHNLIQDFLINLGMCNKIVNLLTEQIIWVTIGAIISFICWKLASRKLVIQGG